MPLSSNTTDAAALTLSCPMAAAAAAAPPAAELDARFTMAAPKVPNARLRKRDRFSSDARPDSTRRDSRALRAEMRMT